MERTIEVGRTYRHFKGGLVRVIYIALDSETMEKKVVYKHIDDEIIWVRDYDMFNSLVDFEKYPDVKQKYRFEEIDD